ncbi:MAG: hypothetical protein JXR50_01165 [Prolixibacteraceae bacterium]|nr:hypothetical protein [Prolixibacteraceae bacterium]MBN2648330.1 hypothetical protein [Prolixibacteraceae bacterium]
MKSPQHHIDKQKVNELISKQEYGKALNYLHNIRLNTSDTKKIDALIEQINTILRFQNRDVFASTNLDMDPWFE